MFGRRPPGIVGRMVAVIVVVVGVLLLAAVGIVIAFWSRRDRTTAASDDTTGPAPMSLLERALDRAHDDSTATMRDRLDAMTPKIESLPPSDDGLLLGHALDDAERST